MGYEFTPITGLMVGFEYTSDTEGYKYLVLDFFLVRITFHFDTYD
tara:strand:+ start:178 stop:312 length:135 start_codon:yes stop_codon:yes gene_type:complete